MMFEELAARADWAILPPEACNHAPIVTAQVKDFTAAPGETVAMEAQAADPDGDELTQSWYVPCKACVYAAKIEEGENDGGSSGGGPKQGDFDLPVIADGLTARVTIPEDAQAGDSFVVNLKVRDSAERPMTRFAQFVITVK